LIFCLGAVDRENRQPTPQECAVLLEWNSGRHDSIAVGLAQALNEESTRNLSVCFIGDGSLGEGVVYEAFNLAAKWQVPVLFAIEGHGYAQ